MPPRDFPEDDPSEAPETPVQEFKTGVNQLEIAARLQEKWLQRMEFLLDHGMITSTDLATLSRVLLQNGWSLDPKRLPKGLQALVSKVEFDDEGRPRLMKVS